MSELKFLTYEDLEQIRMEYGTPSFVYDENTLRQKAVNQKLFLIPLVYFPAML